MAGIKLLGQQGLTLYDESLKEKIPRFSDIDDFVTRAQIDSLFEDPIPSFGTATEQEFVDIINGYYDGTYSLNQIQSTWHVGDTRDIIFNGANSGYNFPSHRQQTVTLQILDFKHDNLTTSINGKTKALITVDFKNCLRDASVGDNSGYQNTENSFMESGQSNTNGWGGCKMHGRLNSYSYMNFYDSSFPVYIKQLIKPVNKLTSIGGQNSNITISSDKLFLLSEVEVWDRHYYSPEGEGYIYSLYETESNRIKLPIGSWWLRSPDIDNSTHFCCADNSYGSFSVSASPANNTWGVAPAFCL